jgi:hypothetical protein
MAREVREPSKPVEDAPDISITPTKVMATLNDLKFTGEDSEVFIPDFAKLRSDNVAWNDKIGKEYLTNKIVVFRRLNMKEIEMCNIAAQEAINDEEQGRFDLELMKQVIHASLRPEITIQMINDDWQDDVFKWMMFQSEKAQGWKAKQYLEVKNLRKTSS